MLKCPIRILLPSEMSRPRKPEVQLPPHVHQVKVKGRPYFYLAKGRGTERAAKPIRLPNDPNSPEFWAAYSAALGKPEPKPATSSLSQLVAAYKASPEWTQLAEGTKVNWALHLRRAEEAWGPLQVAGIRPAHVLALRDKFAETPGAANNLLRALSSMMSWSIPREWRIDNPCLHVQKLKGGDGYEPWPWEMIGLMREKGPAHLWYATAVALFTGQREGDCLEMTWARVRDGRVLVKQEKTGKYLEIPLHRDLTAMLAGIRRTSTHILTSMKGKPWTAHGFRSSWRKAIIGTDANPSPLKPIHDARLVFHGLRKSAVVALLEAGCTEAETQAITGQSPKMIAHYAKQVNQAKLAAAAILKWERAANESL